MTGVLKRGKFAQRRANGEAGYVKIEAGLESHCHRPSNVKDCQQAPEARSSKDGLFHRGKHGSMALPTYCSWTSGPQNCERMLFYCLKPPSLWQLVMAALGN